jgi:hypothetical protein
MVTPLLVKDISGASAQSDHIGDSYTIDANGNRVAAR